MIDMVDSERGMCQRCAGHVVEDRFPDLATDEEDYFSKEDDDDLEAAAGTSPRISNGVTPHPSLSGSFTLGSLVDYEDDEEDAFDSAKGARRLGPPALKFLCKVVGKGACGLHMELHCCMDAPTCSAARLSACCRDLLTELF
jgi:hypothetical protein